MTVRYNTHEEDMDTVFQQVEETKPQFLLIHTYVKGTKASSNSIDNYARKIGTRCRWQRSQGRKYILIGPKSSTLWKHPLLEQTCNKSDAIPGYSSRIRTNCEYIENAMYYNKHGERKLSTYQAVLRGIKVYMHATNRIQKGEYLYSVEHEESTETSISFDIDIQGKTYTEQFRDDASGKPLDYDKYEGSAQV